MLQLKVVFFSILQYYLMHVNIIGQIILLISQDTVCYVHPK